MTCQELRLYFEDPLRCDDELRPELEHLAHCPDCTRFVEAQRELGSNLRLFRESEPVFPSSLDSAVLANYRKQLTERTNPVIARPPSDSFAILRWSAVAAAFALIAVLLYFSAQKKPQTIAQPQVFQPTVPPASHPVHRAAQGPNSKPARVTRPKVHFGSPAPVVAATADPLPPGFRSLMYCDEFSCGDLMELIRVQLPPSAFPFGGSAAAPPISADVIVGPDGIARGIRVVE